MYRENKSFLAHLLFVPIGVCFELSSFQTPPNGFHTVSISMRFVADLVLDDGAVSGFSLLLLLLARWSRADTRLRCSALGCVWSAAVSRGMQNSKAKERKIAKVRCI